MVKVRLTKLDGTVVEKWVEKPRYGGTLRMLVSSDPVDLDQNIGLEHSTWSMGLTNEELFEGDWARGPAGTGEARWVITTLYTPPNLMVGVLAEKIWEVPDANTLVFHIRKGVKFAVNPQSEASRLVNGRELNADDVVFSFTRTWTNPRSYVATTYPYAEYIESITAPDKWTVVIRAKPGKIGPVFLTATVNVRIVPREVVEKYGDLRGWRNSVGSGPFMLMDYVTGAALTFARNPNYWRKDPVHPENRLPYLDSVKMMIIPDAVQIRNFTKPWRNDLDSNSYP